MVFVSADNEEGEFDEYFTEMPWAAVKYAFEGREAIGEKFGVVRARPPPRQPARPPPHRAPQRAAHPPHPTRAHALILPRPPQEGIPRVIVLNAATGAVVDDAARATIVAAKSCKAAVFDK